MPCTLGRFPTVSGSKTAQECTNGRIRGSNPSRQSYALKKKINLIVPFCLVKISHTSENWPDPMLKRCTYVAIALEPVVREAFASAKNCPRPMNYSENTHHWGKDQCTAGIQFNKYAWDLNLGQQDGRPRRIQKPIPAPHQNTTNSLLKASTMKCDQIVRFIGFWATFQSLWQQLIYPNLLHS